ncbi:uncharacterized protein PG986_009666 [Apiospora aurea]|uniref:Uncharacterized protein n=1 Tax=Apiospora aurea TaxID=335848 RepID=A0ABR1Q8E1_9PEZI
MSPDLLYHVFTDSDQTEKLGFRDFVVSEIISRINKEGGCVREDSVATAEEHIASLRQIITDSEIYIYKKSGEHHIFVWVTDGTKLLCQKLDLIGTITRGMVLSAAISDKQNPEEQNPERNPFSIYFVQLGSNLAVRDLFSTLAGKLQSEFQRRLDEGREQGDEMCKKAQANYLKNGVEGKEAYCKKNVDMVDFVQLASFDVAEKNPMGYLGKILKGTKPRPVLAQEN